MLIKIALKGGLNEREAVFTVEPKFSEDAAGESSKADFFYFSIFQIYQVTLNKTKTRGTVLFLKLVRFIRN